MPFNPKVLVATLALAGSFLTVPIAMADETPVTNATQTSASQSSSQSTTSQSQSSRAASNSDSSQVSSSQSQSSTESTPTTAKTDASATKSSTSTTMVKRESTKFQAHAESQASSVASSTSQQPATTPAASSSSQKQPVAQPKKAKAKVKRPAKIKTYNRAVHLTKTLHFKHYRFYAKPKTKKTTKRLNRTTTHYYFKKVRVTRQARTVKGIYFKTYFQKQYLGWVNRDATLNKIYASCKYPYKLTIQNHHAKLYSGPAGTKHVKRLGTVASLKVGTKITGLQRKDLNYNKRNGYIKFHQKKHTYWIKAENVKFRALNRMKGHNSVIERAISAGMRWVGKSKYNWGGGRTAADVARHSFDCSSFVHYMYACAGIQLGNRATATTYSEVGLGRKASLKHIRRGDILFFTAPGEGVNCHVGLYLGKKLFINDSPSADTGGVGISSLLQKGWYKYANGNVRRIV